jgi:hypothetical protein
MEPWDVAAEIQRRRVLGLPMELAEVEDMLGDCIDRTGEPCEERETTASSIRSALLGLETAKTIKQVQDALADLFAEIGVRRPSDEARDVAENLAKVFHDHFNGL